MKLTDKYIVNLNHLDKDKFLKYPGVQGLTLRVMHGHQQLRLGSISTDLKAKSL